MAYQLWLEEHEVKKGKPLVIIQHQRPDLSFMDVIYQASQKKPEILRQKDIFISPGSIQLSKEDQYLRLDEAHWEADNVEIEEEKYPDFKCYAPIVKNVLELYRLCLLKSITANVHYVYLTASEKGVVLICEKDEDIDKVLQFFKTI